MRKMVVVARTRVMTQMMWTRAEERRSEEAGGNEQIVREGSKK